MQEQSQYTSDITRIIGEIHSINEQKKTIDHLKRKIDSIQDEVWKESDSVRTS